MLHVSKVVLGGCSDFFQRMFDSGMIEDSQSIAELRVKVGQKEACKDAIRYDMHFLMLAFVWGVSVGGPCVRREGVTYVIIHVNTTVATV